MWHRLNAGSRGERAKALASAGVPVRPLLRPRQRRPHGAGAERVPADAQAVPITHGESEPTDRPGVDRVVDAFAVGVRDNGGGGPEAFLPGRRVHSRVLPLSSGGLRVQSDGAGVRAGGHLHASCCRRPRVPGAGGYCAPGGVLRRVADLLEMGPEAQRVRVASTESARERKPAASEDTAVPALSRDAQRQRRRTGVEVCEGEPQSRRRRGRGRRVLRSHRRGSPTAQSHPLGEPRFDSAIPPTRGTSFMRNCPPPLGPP
mmetsp:Transcript_2869/g.6512  ORF Transcript_2869/g.6512 Transcript_2869/m.6512 type:complete len:260 (+) Transcript_2869:334-1113(+)